MDRKCPVLHSTSEGMPSLEEISVDTETGLKYEQCPYKGGVSPVNKAPEEDSDDEQPSGGCPVMHKTGKEPVEKQYGRYFEMPKFRPYDFLFNMRGGLSEAEFNQKTSKIRQMSRHKLYTVFQNDENLRKLRQKEYPMVFFVFDDIKSKGNKQFKKGLFDEAYELYCTVIS